MTSITAPQPSPAAAAPAPGGVGAYLRGVAPYVGIAAIVVFCLTPFYWMAVSAFRRPADQFRNTPLPLPFSVENFSGAFAPGNGFARALLNSLVVAGVTTLLTLIVGTFTAYALARLDFRFKNAVLAMIIATSMFPGIALLVPLLKLFTGIGWINSYQAMIVPTLGSALPLAVWNLTVFFKQLPFELEQAAMVDGCTRGEAFRKIVIPLAAPGVFTTAIITFIFVWNEFIIALSMVNKTEMQTATVAISKFTGAYGFDQPFGTQMAAGVIVTVPLVVVVLIFQRRIVAGLTAGGIK
jgi:trehalose/maltose transport system permease protein